MTAEPTARAGRARGTPVFLWIFAAAALAVIPALFLGSAWGHDFDFHVSMWIDAAHQAQQGIFFPRWTALANAGFGEPSVIFYPPLSWMAGSVLGLILPWKFVPCIFVFLTLALAGFAMWKLAGDWLAPRDALVAGLLYAWNPYILTTAFKRADYAELLADALFPLLVWAAIRVAGDSRRMIPPLAVVFAAIWLCDLPAGMIAGYSLALLMAVQCFSLRTWRPAIEGAIAVVFGFGLTAFFLLPAASERQWVEIGLALIPEWTPDTNYLFTQNPSSIMTVFNKGLSLIAVTLMAIAAIAALLSRRAQSTSDDSQPSRIWKLIVVLAAASAFVMFRASSFLWKILPEFEYIEYPWRWLTPLAAATTLLATAAMAGFRRKSMWRAVAALGALCVGGGILYTVRWDRGGRQIESLAAAAQSGVGYRFAEDRDWRRPRGSHPSRLPDSAPPLTVNGDPQSVRFNVERWTSERKVFSVDSAHPAVLGIKLLNYPAWQARWNGAPIRLQTDPQTGQMLLDTPGGSGNVEIYCSRPPDRTAGLAISGFAILTLTGLALKWRANG